MLIVNPVTRIMLDNDFANRCVTAFDKENEKEVAELIITKARKRNLITKIFGEIKSKEGRVQSRSRNQWLW